ncbi:MAG: hypothetical protein JRJ65_11110 [Deltaproteobacteria bacterium]|nr:hypothetical protein [Deltaproteobacteria bacterium]
MAKIIPLEPKSKGPPDNVISLKPLEFRKADWETTRFVQMVRSNSAKLELHREAIYKKGDNGVVWQIPPHYSLTEGMAHTIRALYNYRENEEKMREVYYLIGLADCMINQVNPILRTDLIRDIYRKVFEMRKDLKIHWYGPLAQILLPVDSQFYTEFEYKASLTGAGTMRELYRAIKKGADEMFDILSLEYVFYCPSAGFQS